ncbi:urease accessory protein UreF [Sediminicoccus rosea]|uniref:Urease accessory protein UreF n=1 Tax=Sediminicoccus rosea TaxID=1225128 RepID=A0ABZ0PH09_9PROT|nr:urease accessory protein UreF [Sediminicoccus rosea]WPB85024.1 urease accessory protein UreF [Sediminicoccus rosea]
MGTTMGTTTATTTAMSTTTIMATGTITITTVTDADLFRLMAWTSPAYPVGGFSYSHGIEMAVEEGRLKKQADLVAYIASVLRQGAGRVDAVLFAEAHRAPDEEVLDEIAELAFAWRGTAETALESTQQGGSFASVTVSCWPDARFAAFAARHRGRLSHAVAFGAAAGMAGIPLRPALFAFLQGFCANLVSAGVRLIPLGQTDGQIATAALQPIISECADAALTTPLEELGTAAPLLDMLSMRHETQYTRLFRS